MSQLLNFEELSPQALRDKALLELFYGSGLRLTGWLLPNASLDLEQGVVTVKGKGNKTCSVPLGRLCIGVSLAQGHGCGQWLFPGRNGQSISPAW